MTVRVLVACDAAHMDPLSEERCVGFLPVSRQMDEGTVGGASAIAEVAGWKRDGDRHVCPACQSRGVGELI